MSRRNRRNALKAVSGFDERPCGYCWYHECDLDGMECAEKHQPEGGFAETHPECERAVALYMEARYNDER